MQNGKNDADDEGGDEDATPSLVVFQIQQIMPQQQDGRDNANQNKFGQDGPHQMGVVNQHVGLEVDQKCQYAIKDAEADGRDDYAEQNANHIGVFS